MFLSRPSKDGFARLVVFVEKCPSNAHIFFNDFARDLVHIQSAIKLFINGGQVWAPFPLSTLRNNFETWV